MRLLKVGAVGSAMFVWGMVDATKDPKDRVFGGYFQPGDKRNDQDVGWGKIRIDGHEFPHLVTHNPLTESAQMGATFMRVTLSKFRKRDLENKGYLAGAMASLVGLASEAPIVNPITAQTQAVARGQANKIVWDELAGLVPQLVQNIAQDVDQKSRTPRNLKEAIEETIPVVRENVPESKNQIKKDKQAKPISPYR